MEANKQDGFYGVCPRCGEESEQFFQGTQTFQGVELFDVYNCSNPDCETGYATVVGTRQEVRNGALDEWINEDLGKKVT